MCVKLFKILKNNDVVHIFLPGDVSILFCSDCKYCMYNVHHLLVFNITKLVGNLNCSFSAATLSSIEIFNWIFTKCLLAWMSGFFSRNISDEAEKHSNYRQLLRNHCFYWTWGVKELSGYIKHVWCSSSVVTLNMSGVVAQWLHCTCLV